MFCKTQHQLNNKWILMHCEICVCRTHSSFGILLEFGGPVMGRNTELVKGYL